MLTMEEICKLAKTKKGRLLAIVEELKAGASAMPDREVIQRRPFTCVRFYATFMGTTYVLIGFSKVSWPDEWSEKHGVALATEKAYAACARQILADYEAELVTRVLNLAQ